MFCRDGSCSASRGANRDAVYTGLEGLAPQEPQDLQLNTREASGRHRSRRDATIVVASVLRTRSRAGDDCGRGGGTPERPPRALDPGAASRR